MVAEFTGTIDNHFPKTKILAGLPALPIKREPHAAPPPRSSLTHLAFSDSNKNRSGVLIQYPDSKDVTYVIPNPGSIQLGELWAFLRFLVECQTELLASLLVASLCAGFFSGQRLTDPHYQHYVAHTGCLKSED